MRTAVAFIALTACNAWVRPAPSPAANRLPMAQQESAVKIVTYCDTYEDGRARVGTGVMVSDWQVLTALHVVDCPANIPTIWVYNFKGQRWTFVPEKEWTVRYPKKRDGIARIQMSSADTLRPKFNPPSVSSEPIDFGEPLYLQAAAPERVEHTGNATGWTYGGSSYGGRTFTYSIPTEEGNSGSGIYNVAGDLVGIHLGWMDSYKYGAIVTTEMVPH